MQKITRKDVEHIAHLSDLLDSMPTDLLPGRAYRDLLVFFATIHPDVFVEVFNFYVTAQERYNTA